jgi:hypothetical protein
MPVEHSSDSVREISAIDLSTLAVSDLLVFHARIADDLRRRGITRTSNNPTGDLAEYLCCKTFGWTQADNSKANVDAIGPDGIRYQIKGRRLTRHNNSRQLSAIRDLNGAHFDFLAGVLLSENYAIQRAAIIPYSVCVARSSFVKRTNSYKFILHDDVWDVAGVRDVTSELRATIL